MTKISNTLLKAKIDIRKIVFKQILDNFGGHLRVVLYGAAPMNKATIIGYNNLGISLVQGYGLTETSPVVTAETDKEKKTRINRTSTSKPKPKNSKTQTTKE